MFSLTGTDSKFNNIKLKQYEHQKQTKPTNKQKKQWFAAHHYFHIRKMPNTNNAKKEA